MQPGFVLYPAGPSRTFRHRNDHGGAPPDHLQSDAGAGYDIREVIVAARRVTYDGPPA